MRVFQGHTSSVHAVVVSPDSRWALSASEDRSLRVWEFVWDYEFPEPSDWHKGARPYLQAFVRLRRAPGDDGISRDGRPSWDGASFDELMGQLQRSGYGWLRPDGVRRELERMTAPWYALVRCFWRRP